MPDVSDEYLEFMKSQQAEASDPAHPLTRSPAQDFMLGPIVPSYVFNGDPERGIKADYRFAAYADIELNRIEHCMFYYAGAGPEDPMWPRPKIKLLPETVADRWDYVKLPPPPPGLYWKVTNAWRRIRTRIIEALPISFRRYVY